MPVRDTGLQQMTHLHMIQAVRAESKDIIFDQDSRKRMQAGINKLADAVGVTLGPRGDTKCLSMNAFMYHVHARVLCGMRIHYL